jgi:3-oxoacyl-[acyl-carrier-protein] synthase II
MSNPGPEVWITGIGLMLPMGPEGRARESAWAALRAGRGRAWPLAPPRDDHPGEPPHHGFPAPDRERFGPDFDPAPRMMDHVAIEAAHDARILVAGAPVDRDRVAVLIGSSKGRTFELERLRAAHLGQTVSGPDRSGLFDRFWPHGASSRVARLLRFRGPCTCPVAACATGLVAAIQGAQMIRQGTCDLALCGAVDASLTPFLLGAFRRMRALAPVAAGEDPTRAIRPWDRDRRGFLVGEGAAVLVLERADHARARGATPHAAMAGGAIGSDAYHMVDQNPDPAGLAHLIGLALRDAHTDASEVDHVNVHGTATRSNDPLECRALRRALGPHADSVSCSANKAQIGHLLGAAGAAELAITAMAVRDQFAPPTMNLERPDPACDLDATPGVGRARPIRAALKLSLGFGGHLAAAVLRAV